MRRPRRKAEDTRAEILDTAELLFARNGISGCSIAHIAQALGMSPANVFKHFHSKISLADAICDRHIVKMVDRLKAVETEAPAPERLGVVVRQLMNIHLEAMREAPFMFEMILMLAETKIASGRHYEQMLQSLFCDLIRHGVESGVYYCSDPIRRGRAVAAAFACVLHPVFLVNEPPEELQARCDETVELVNIALQNPLAK
ncbi:TetR family transcriptional regulator [Rhizobium helianthi]|uniref:TetR family transcriptional regulator n=1 Tax=Rhizobium helianthi TaxID=1132695 RepID=A0ABW4M8R1_9HYPH